MDDSIIVDMGRLVVVVVVTVVEEFNDVGNGKRLSCNRTLDLVAELEVGVDVDLEFLLFNSICDEFRRVLANASLDLPLIQILLESLFLSSFNFEVLFFEIAIEDFLTLDDGILPICGIEEVDCGRAGRLI